MGYMTLGLATSSYAIPVLNTQDHVFREEEVVKQSA
jgi:hypothetical protein